MKSFIGCISGIGAFACLLIGIIIGLKENANYNEANFYLLLSVINYLTSIDNLNNNG